MMMIAFRILIFLLKSLGFTKLIRCRPMLSWRYRHWYVRYRVADVGTKWSRVKLVAVVEKRHWLRIYTAVVKPVNLSVSICDKRGMFAPRIDTSIE